MEWRSLLRYTVYILLAQRIIFDHKPPVMLRAMINQSVLLKSDQSLQFNSLYFTDK